MRPRGQITVFLSLVLVCICALMLGILESARTAGARCYLRTAADSALDSLFSQYHRKLWDQYRILGMEYEDQDDIEDRFQAWISPYFTEGNFYPMNTRELQVTALKKLTGDRGAHLEQEILQYMKYGIWQTDITEENAGGIFDKMKEAQALKGLSDLYSGHTREAVRLEESLEKISLCIGEQEERYRLAEEELLAEDGPAFRREAGRLIRELERIPGLVKDYSKKADALSAALEESKKRFMEEQGDLSPELRDSLEQEIQRYEEYTDRDGARRGEVEALAPASEDNIYLVTETIEEALRVEEMIEEWEESEEGGEGPDTAELWRPVQERFAGCSHLKLSFQPGVKDKEKQNFLEQVQKMVDFDLLKLVLPEGTEVSNGVLDLSLAPSATEWNGEGASGIGDAISGRVKGILVDEYCVQFFRDFLTPEKQEVQYETEYVIGEQVTDENNLKDVVLRILAIREGVNLAWLLTNPEKRKEADALASVIAGVTGAAPLTAVISFFILCMWALAEAVNDVKTLLHGWKVPLWKSEADWKVSLQGLLDMGKNGTVGADSRQQGLDYASYLKILLFMKKPEKKLYRMMDVMQMNIRREQDDFLMSHCAYSVDISADNRGKHVFFSLALWKSVMGKGQNDYEMTVEVQKAY